ncbi:hypothetical protein ACFOYU_07670 [Microvirga sp. GCM10011540]|uniref:hypothetical protein n=1 Tax=Microvirga sp. GCM10011540 TaxID=3317338 RepID=UPI003623B458
MIKSVGAVLAAALALAGCKTTEEAARSVRAKWIGEPIDRFFVENGPPVSSYALDSGGTIYTWRGGEMDFVRPAQYQTRPAFSSPMKVSERTTTVTAHPAPGVTVTRSKTTSSSFGFAAPQVTTMVRPPQHVHLVCEAQITADDQGIIQAVRINRDTEGAAFSLSRCGDIFGD